MSTVMDLAHSSPVGTSPHCLHKINTLGDGGEAGAAVNLARIEEAT